MTRSEQRKTIVPPRVTIPIGPQHPALKEPGMFKLTLEGERIVDAEVNISYNHRGIEKATEGNLHTQNLYLLARICGICSATHNGNYAQAVEFAAEEEPPERAKFIRTLTWEMDRIHSHMLWFGVACHEIGFETLFMYAWRDRELALDMLEDLSGARIHHDMNTIGGVRRDISDELAQSLIKRLDKLEERMDYYLNTAMNDRSLLNRVEDVGILETAVARSHGAVGPTARGSNVPTDVRFTDPTQSYPLLNDTEYFSMILSKRCDVAGRTIVRLKEIVQAIQMSRWLIENLPDGPISKKMSARIQPNEVLARHEAPRGELVHYLITNGTSKPERVKIRAPTHANWVSMEHTLKGYQIADAPIILAAIDPCYSCTDRIALVDAEDDSIEIVSKEQLRVRANKWYDEHQ